MSSKGSSGGVSTIQPCYDGRLLPGLNHVAGEGLSAISVKLCHRQCKFTADPRSRQPLVTCHQGINARNSFWNLHKPDLRKVKGLECSTSESMAQLFRAHNVENAGKPTYKRRMLRLLESLVVKKSKTSENSAEVLVQNRHWAANQCVLAPLVHETEMKSPKIVNMHDDFSSSQLEDGSEIYNEKLENTVDSVDTLFISQTQGANMLTNSSENTFIGIGFNQVIEPSNGGLSDLFTPLKETSGLDTARALSISAVPSCLKLTNKQPLPHLSAVSTTKGQHCEFDRGNVEHPNLSSNVKDEHNQVVTNDYVGLDGIDTTKVVRNASIINQGTSIPSKCSSIPSRLVINTIVDEMLEEMQEIEDYISSYTSSFCVSEEEYTNYQALTEKSSELVEHFIEIVRSTEKQKIENTGSQSTNQSEDGMPPSCQITDLLLNSKLFNPIDVNNSTQEQNLNGGDIEATPTQTTDSGIDLNTTEFNDSQKNAILNKSNTISSVMLRNSSSSINLIEFDEINVAKCKNDCSTEITSTKRGTAANNKEFNVKSNTDFRTQENKRTSLQNYALEDISIIDEGLQNKNNSKDYKSIINNILRTNIISAGTFDINNSTNGYCFWEDSDVATDTGMSTEISTNDSDTNLTPENTFSHTGSALVSSTFMKDVWRQCLEGENEDDLFTHVDGSGLCNDGPFSSYGYWKTLYDNEAYVEAEDQVHGINSFIVSECAPPGPMGSNCYNDKCTIFEIEQVFSQTETIGEVNSVAGKGSFANSRCTATDTTVEGFGFASKTMQNDEAFELYENESRYSENDSRHSRSHIYFLDNSGDIDIENGKRKSDNAANRVTEAQKDNNPDKLNYENSLTERSRLVQVPGNTDELEIQSPQMIFTSPNIQLNLTNPIVNQNKKSL